MSALEEHDSMEAIVEALFMSRILGYSDEHNQAGLEEAWRGLESERVVPDCVRL